MEENVDSPFVRQESGTIYEEIEAVKAKPRRRGGNSHDRRHCVAEA